jgi:hypothetical protein
MSFPRIRFSSTMLLVLSLSSCQKSPLVVAGENIVTLKESGTTGCTITIANPQVQGSPKDPKAHVELSSAASEPLTFVSADNVYQVSFPSGSPLDAGSNLTIQSGATQSYSISFWTRFKAQFSEKTYQFDAYDPAQHKCDPIVHVTK